MNALAGPVPLTVTLAETAEPEEPGLREGIDPLDVTPGVLGFLVPFAVVLASLVLFVSMARKVRGVDYRDRLRREEEAARAAGDRDDADDDGTADDGAPGDGGPRGR